MTQRTAKTPAHASTEVNFNAGYYEAQVIRKIARRWKMLSDDKRQLMDVNMDITATHCNGNPLRLQELLDADDFNFLHDVSGIVRHIDRTTGKLTNFFSPRYSRRN